MARSRIMICSTCGCSDWTTSARGSVILCILLWLVFFPAGIVYTLWMLTTRRRRCLACGSTNLIPADSPMGRRLVQEIQR